MANLRWVGKAIAVAQTATVQVTAYDVATTYKLTVGGVVVSTIGTGGTVNTTATALAAAWNASTHTFFTGVTASASTDTVTLTADTAGVPFTATSSVTGGTGTIGSVTAGTANAGPNVLAAANFDTGSLPTNSDVIVFENSSVDLLWNLDALTSVTGLTIIIHKSFTGKIGLNKRVFQVTSTTTSTTAEEYREDEFTCDGWTLLSLPAYFGTGAPSGSNRLLFNGKTSQTTTVIEDTFQGSAELNEPVRIRGTHTSNSLYVSGGIVGFSTNDPFDAGALATLYVSEQSKVNVGSGVTTLTAVNVSGSSTAYIQCAATTVTISEGSLTTQGTGAITTFNSKGGNSILKSSGTITTMNLDGGLVDMTEDSRAKTITTLSSTAAKGVSGTIIYDPAVVTVNSKLAPARRVAVICTGA